MKRLLVVGAALTLYSTIPAAQEILFKPVQEKIVRAEDGRETQRIEFNFKTLKPGESARIRLNLGGKDIEIDLEPVSPKTLGLPKGQAAWHWMPRKSDGNEAFFLAGKGFVRGNITLNGITYELKAFEGGLQAIDIVDPKRAYPEDHPREFRNDQPVAPRDRDSAFPVDRDCDDPADEIDVMVVYTDDARSAAGGTAQMEAEIAFAIAQGNLANANSNVFHRLYLVHTSEVAYTEPAAGVDFGTTIDELKDTSDGVIDGVHALRDTHKADLVALVTETSASGCGLGYVIDPAGTTSDQFAFSVAKRSCIGGNFSLAHELGHNLSARHDRAAYSPLPSSTTDYNWGHTQPSPSGTASPWRTVMSYNDACVDAGTSCTRISQFSNPNVNFGGDPTGTPLTDSNPEHNVQAFADLDGPASEFRCRTSGATANVWMKDTWQDSGLEPDPATAAQPMWQSPYIWVRNNQDAALTNLHVHENPVLGQTNFVYVKAHNDGTTAANGTMELYFADAATNLNDPANWSAIGTNSTPISNGTTITEFSWSGLPGTGHYCLLARWNEPGTALSFTNVNTQVRNSNDHVWRNINIVDVGADAEPDQEYVMIMRGKGEAFLVVRKEISDSTRVPWEKIGQVKVTFKAEGSELDGLRYEGAEKIDDATFAVDLGKRPAVFGPFRLKEGQDLPVVILAQIDRNAADEAQKIAPNGAVLDMTFSQTSAEGANVAIKEPAAFYGKEGLVDGGVSYIFRVPAKEDKASRK